MLNMVFAILIAAKFLKHPEAQYPWWGLVVMYVFFFLLVQLALWLTDPATGKRIAEIAYGRKIKNELKKAADEAQKIVDGKS